MTDYKALADELPECEFCKGTGEQVGWTDAGGSMRCVPESCDYCKGSGLAPLYAGFAIKYLRAQFTEAKLLLWHLPQWGRPPQIAPGF